MTSPDTASEPAGGTGRLPDRVPRDRRGACVPDRVARAIDALDVDVFEVDDDASDTERCSARYGIDLEDCANTLVIRYR